MMQTHSIHNKEENYYIFYCHSIKFTLGIHIVLKSWFGSKLQTKYASLFKILLGRSFTEQNCLFVQLKTPSQPKMLKRYCTVFLCNIKSILKMDGVTEKKHIFLFVALIYQTHWPKLCIVCTEKGKPDKLNFLDPAYPLVHWALCSSHDLPRKPASEKKEKTPCMHWLYVRWCVLQGDYQTFKHHATASTL